MKKKYNDDLFVCLNWILKKTNNSINLSGQPSIFLLNRWLSMSDPNLVLIINNTFNRWIKSSSISKETEMCKKFYRILMPKTFKNFKYIKKNQESEKKEEDIYSNLEISKREIELYNNTLDFLSGSFK
jgi:hypothetical protein